MAWPPSSQVLAKYTVRGCTRREAEIGYLLESGLEVADDDELDEISADLNMSCSRVSTMNGRIVCLLPGATIWLFRRGRRLLGEEALHLQGCFVPDRLILKQNFTNSQLRDLGGNAFNASSLLLLLRGFLNVWEARGLSWMQMSCNAALLCISEGSWIRLGGADA